MTSHFAQKIVSICLGVSALSLLLAGIALLSIDLVNMRDTLRNKLINQAEIIGRGEVFTACTKPELEQKRTTMAGPGLPAKTSHKTTTSTA